MPAPKGNKNAFRHGIYSKFIAVIDDEEMKGMKLDFNKDELAYARVRLAAAQKSLAEAEDEGMRLNWDQACQHWTEIILTAIAHNAIRPETQVVIYETFFDALRGANDKDKVK